MNKNIDTTNELVEVVERFKAKRARSKFNNKSINREYSILAKMLIDSKVILNKDTLTKLLKYADKRGYVRRETGSVPWYIGIDK